MVGKSLETLSRVWYLIYDKDDSEMIKDYLFTECFWEVVYPDGGKIHQTPITHDMQKSVPDELQI